MKIPPISADVKSLGLYKEDDKPLPPETAGKKYSGKFLLRPGKELHKILVIWALQADESLNNFCQNALKKVIFHSNRSNGQRGQLDRKQLGDFSNVVIVKSCLCFPEKSGPDFLCLFCLCRKPLILDGLVKSP
ncbi:MAG: toxin-antitoxin system HicB family antitoxin [Deltaproteobacteria bacterium]|nr:toxin-antitoxin system HicB family antitoxin [Deltaproteobacteria bacterium]